MPQKEREVVASIQALRAVAVLFVVVNHLFPHALPGGYIGVDIFFVVSGFLISSHLLKELRGGTLNFSRFYLRRARRLLPASLLVLAVTAICVYLLIPPAWQARNLKDIAAAGVYGVNWWLAANAVNYFADSGGASPVNHYWSLSVEEQFYLLWPALLYFSLRAARLKSRRSAEGSVPGVPVVMTVVLVLSFVSAILAVHHNHSAAYFVTYARGWEFAVGGLTALSVPHFMSRSRQSLNELLFVVAWLVLIASGWFLRPESGVPGFAATPAVCATAMILVIGDNLASPLLRWIVGLPPVQWLGNISYSLYLWHWPLLVLTPIAMGVAKLKIVSRLGLLGISLVVSDCTKRQIEDRFRFPRLARKPGPPSLHDAPVLATYLLMSLGVAGCALAGARAVENKSYKVGEQLYRLSLNPGPCFGARATEPGANCPNSHFLADRDFAMQNWEAQINKLPNGGYCQNALGDSVVAPCEFGAPVSTVKRRVALIGDSHAGMWEAALAMFATSSGIRVRSFVASLCVVTDDDRSLAVYLAPEYRDACRKWRKGAEEAIIADPQIETVIVTDNAYNQRILTATGNWSEDDGRGIAETLRRFRAAGKRVLVIDDVPNLAEMLPDCLARARTYNDPCTTDERQIPMSTPLGRAAALMPAGEIGYLTIKDVFCDGILCHAVVGGIPAYMDRDHISAPFARSLANRLEEFINSDGPSSRRSGVSAS